MSKYIKIFADENPLTTSEIENRFGISKATLLSRYRNGLRGDKLIMPNHTKKYEYGGMIHTVSEWAEITGLKKATILSRLRNKWTFEQAIGVSPRKRRHRIQKNTSLCIYCQNARADRCKWVRDLTPINGWDAEPIMIKNEITGNILNSFRVNQCPGFKGDEEFEN